MVVKIVVGANFGDEGKGLMTDHFCHQAISRGQKCIVVLHNGGAQRGHTVSSSEGRHVFHHFGSGTLIGADTYLSEDFIVNPIVFRSEYEQLEYCVDKMPKIYMNPNCKISTPFDMIANQIIEENRGEKKHGSCGLGIWETIRRHQYYTSTSLDSLYLISSQKHDAAFLRDRVWYRYYADRLDSKNIKITEEWSDIIGDDGLLDHYFEDIAFMHDHVEYDDVDNNILKNYDCVVFEGGQGLLLDQHNKEYIPNITPSNTGIDNPLKILDSFSDDTEIDGEVCYVTRSYLTRHGAGKFFTECSKDEINSDMMDFTNVHNIHQGSLRYGKLSFPDLWIRTCNDFNKSRDKYNFKKSLAITHKNEYYNESQVKRVCTELDFDTVYVSDDEDRRNIYAPVY